MKTSPLAKLLILAAVTALALASATQAVTPPPDGGYPNQNTAEGDNALFSLTTGLQNTGIGFDALFYNTTGGGNTAIGFEALFTNTAGFSNTAVGVEALYGNTTGYLNTATGSAALICNYTGNENTATGAYALYFNSTGNDNTATGAYAMEGAFAEIAGSDNTATGALALAYIYTGNQNTATGKAALQLNDEGSSNTATGFQALYNSRSDNNTANGAHALYNNTSGINNTSSGVDSLNSNTTGSYNTAHGQGALLANTTGSNNTGVGQNALKNATTGKSNLGLGSNAGYNVTTGSNNIEIFDRGLASDANTIRIGKVGTQKTTYIAGINGSTVAGGVTVVADATGHLGTITSSARYKEAIRPMEEKSESVLALHPVTFRYKKELDPKGIPQFGLVAEQVAKVNPDLVACDEEGKPYTVRYEAVNAMLLNEFIKEHGEVQQLKATVAILQTALKAQAAQIEKVSNRLEASQPTTDLVSNSEK